MEVRLGSSREDRLLKPFCNGCSPFGCQVSRGKRIPELVGRSIFVFVHFFFFCLPAHAFSQLGSSNLASPIFLSA